MKRISFIFLVLSVVSCSQDPETKENEGSFSSPAYIQKAFKENDLSKFPQVVSTEMQFVYDDRFLLKKEMVEEYNLFPPRRAVPGTSGWEALDWQKEDAKMTVFLEKKRNDKMYAYAKQLCALEMLSNTDLLVDDSKEALPVIAKYTHILAEEQNGSPAHFYYALERLKDYWPEDKVKAVSELGIAGGRKSIKGYENAITLFEKEVKGKKDSAMMLDVISGYREINLIYQKYMDRLARL